MMRDRGVLFQARERPCHLGLGLAMRRRSGRWLPLECALAAGLLLSFSLAVPQTFAATARPAERPAAVSSSADPQRTNWFPDEPALSPAAVGRASFGELFSTQLNGPMNGQPIVADGTVVVGTGTDRVYGLDAVSGRVRWSDSLGTPVPQPADCNPVGGTTLGVVSSPVFDKRTGRIYLVAEVNRKKAAEQPRFDMFAIGVRTGTILWKAPIDGAPSNDPGRPFNPGTEMQRPDLLQIGDWVYAAFGSRCEAAAPAYDGYVVGVNTVTRDVTMWTDEVGTGNGGASIWQAGGGLMSDGPGRIYLVSGNGVSPAPGPGTSPTTPTASTCSWSASWAASCSPCAGWTAGWSWPTSPRPCRPVPNPARPPWPARSA